MRINRFKQPRYSKGQKVRCWVGDDWALGYVEGWTRVGSDGFRYNVRFYSGGKGVGAVWQHDMEPEDAVSRLGEIV